MKIVLVGVIAISLCFAQRGPQQKQGRPSDKMTSTLPAQDITITLHLTSELHTAVEKDRWDIQIGDVNQTTGVITNRPSQPTIQDQIIMRLNQIYFGPLLVNYPPPTIKAAQDAAAAATKNAQDVAAKAALATRK